VSRAISATLRQAVVGIETFRSTVPTSGKSAVTSNLWIFPKDSASKAWTDSRSVYPDVAGSSLHDMDSLERAFNQQKTWPAIYLVRQYPDVKKPADHPQTNSRIRQCKLHTASASATTKIKEKESPSPSSRPEWHRECRRAGRCGQPFQYTDSAEKG